VFFVLFPAGRQTAAGPDAPRSLPQGLGQEGTVKFKFNSIASFPEWPSPQVACAEPPPPPLHRPALRTERSAQLSTQSKVLVCVGAAADGVLSGAWYGFAVAPRRTSSGHAPHVFVPPPPPAAPPPPLPRFSSRPRLQARAPPPRRTPHRGLECV
jgi:hypothetical protein